MHEEVCISSSESDNEICESVKKKPRVTFNASSSSIVVAHGRNPTRVNKDKSILERIADELTEDEDLQDNDNVHFCVADELTPADISIEVCELGAMTFPVAREYIQKLINISSKAQFGLREQTILDESIRNTYEIKSDKLCVTINEKSLTCMLSKMRDVLGLDNTCVLTAHLHNMLIYGPGHFFDMHQDTEKLKGMVASLVVVLPSSHIGGDLVIEHDTKRYVFSSENIDHINAKCIGFYSDCRHKVEKIKHGYRIALTYNLVLESGDVCKLKDVNEQLTDAIKEYFDIKLDKQLQDKQPQKFVYFLNHSYTEHGLRLTLLKGADRANASALYRVAQKLGLIFHLALVEIRETWSTEGDYFHSDPDIGEHLSDEITLSYWLDSDNKTLPFDKCDISKDEICLIKETESFEPYNKKYEGFMGNYGGNMEYWYRRAAVVLWPESSQVPMNFMLNYKNALNEINALTCSPGNEQSAMEIMAKAGKYLHRRFYEKEKNCLEKFANIALYIKDKDIALSILSHFERTILNSDIAELLVKLQIQYDISWFIELLNSCKILESQTEDFLINEIHCFVQSFLDYGGTVSIVELLLDAQCNSIINSNKKTYSPTVIWWKKESVSPKKRMDTIYEIILACAAIQNIPVLDKLITYLISNPKSYPDISLAEVFFKLQDAVSSEYFSNFKLLRSYLVATIDSNLALGKRSHDDWSIQGNLFCQCGHCKEAMHFLLSKTDKIKRWPIRKDIRRHIYRAFDGLNLPVDLSTERSGSPYKLIMIKTEQLHKDAKERFDKLKFYEQKLQK